MAGPEEMPTGKAKIEVAKDPMEEPPTERSHLGVRLGDFGSGVVSVPEKHTNQLLQYVAGGLALVLIPGVTIRLAAGNVPNAMIFLMVAFQGISIFVLLWILRRKR